jgi:hypothetical protein
LPIWEPKKMLQARMRELHFAVDFWQEREPRPAEALDIVELVQLAQATTESTGGDQIPKDRRYFLPYALDAGITLEPDAKWDPSTASSDGWTTDKEQRNALAFCGLSVIDELVDMALQYPAKPKAPQSELVRILEASSSPALVFVLMVLADNLARNNWRVEVIPAIYEYALEVAPRPNLHNEIGAILLERAGIEEDALFESDGSTVVISAREFGGAEIRSWDQEDGPMMPEHSSRLVQLAADAFARAYGHYAPEFPSDVSPTLDMYNQASSALDGTRVAAQELGLHDLQWPLYLEHCLLDEAVEQRPGWMVEFAQRFAYSLGLSRGLERGREGHDAILEANRVIDSPVRPGLVDELTNALAKAIRSAPADQLREAETLAAGLAGPAWVELPTKVRDDLAQAEYMERIAYHSSFNWAPVALLYCFAVERLLCDVFGSELKRFLSEVGVTVPVFLKEHGLRFENGLSKGMIGEFVFLMKRCIEDARMAAFMANTSLGHVGYLRDIGGRIDGFNKKYRRITAHPGEPISGAAVRELKRSLYEPPRGSTAPLLSLLANLRMIPETK